MSITINAVIQSGLVKWPALRYDGSGKPEFRFVLYRETTNAEGQVFPLSIPCCSPGSTGERLAEELSEGDFVVVTVGELVYRKRETKAGEDRAKLRQQLETATKQAQAAIATMDARPGGMSPVLQGIKGKLILWSTMAEGELKT